MIAKERKTPLSILKLQALIRRLPPNHEKLPLIKEELLKRNAGYKGELNADYHLSTIKDGITYQFNDLRLIDQSVSFQMDTLLLTASFAAILEVKNIAGTLHFDPVFNQFIRTKDGQETAYADPILQTERLEHYFKRWTAKHRIKPLPTYSFVVISSPKTIIQTETRFQNMLNKKVIHAEKLPSVIQSIRKMNHEKILTEKDLKKTVKLFLKSHNEADYPVIQKFSVEKDEIIKGVICVQCENIMERIHGGWKCKECKSSSKSAHIQALNDYRLLINTSITNKEIREYLRIPSQAAATRLLHSLNLKSTGQNKGRVYELSLNEKSTP
ncbi:nuclease-related domain-containing protein [Bacillus sp. SJS]|uniref:nuclease-related domain-containing protein n=1 Tax=Bacillus sp. SJS TaxID=1423321 RepID=UPI0004DCE709|nr:nuclease-related domain-containing protein [Bacillus sp. SJS]KZZ84834.1 hypothetical protein AS29_007165 [Bacillus sp. SJS]